MNQISDDIAGSALVLEQIEQAARDAREMFLQRCHAEQLSELQIYEIRQAAKVAVKQKDKH